eukprot:Gregarina_sp_Pseudo_9__870@NODE_1558_length_1498_cov_11_497601_g1445_i0_p1_GENE_NODE_1558_length_1498_cov_11_497601_g1445_i0NODE_1558_length_1498_cov_11_497601_g1445_i0_p1_ORF_typecomplete_len275_score48_47PMM/PF03332_13/4_4e59Hydrolase_3/PF08282_12/5_3e07Trehalose_PPase/PF02358_16/0_19Trehalose_PPase/PF02358_16/8_8e02_NODE_1558_length_1498_cov_11_497601_g1445_i02861110
MSRTLFLFDVDGTLSFSQRPVLAENLRELRRLSTEFPNEVEVGVVSGSNDAKVLKQFGLSDLADMFRGSSSPQSPLIDYCFFENGLYAFCLKDNEVHQMSNMNFRKHLGDANYTELIDTILLEFSKIKLPVKTSNFVELRHGTLNVSPIGRACSIEERESFATLDAQLHIREELQRKLTERFGAKMGLAFATGGQISLDIYPEGWDKTFCLSLLDLKNYREIHFFGDRCFPGGNDYALYCDPRVTNPTAVSSPKQTEEKLKRFERKQPSSTNSV